TRTSSRASSFRCSVHGRANRATSAQPSNSFEQPRSNFRSPRWSPTVSVSNRPTKPWRRPEAGSQRKASLCQRIRSDLVLALQRFDAEIAVGHRAVVALQQDGSQGLFIGIMRSARGAFQFGFLVDDLAVMK